MLNNVFNKTLNTKSFYRVELCSHTCNSPLGLCTPKELVFKAKELMINALAICDEYSTNGYTQFYEECKKANIKAIYGASLVIDSFGIVVLAKNKNGVIAIHKIISKAKSSSSVFKFNNDYDDLINYKKDLITIAINPKEEDFEYLFEFYDFIGLSIDNKVNINFIKKYINKIVALSDSYYLEKNDHISFDVLSGFPSVNERILRGHEVLDNLPHQIVYDNPVRISSLIEDDCYVPLKKLKLPELISGNDFKLLVNEKTNEKYLGCVSNEVKKRIEKELNIVSLNKTHNIFYLSYIVAKYMSENKLYFDARLAAAGSLICYVLGISKIDPVKWDIPLESFYGVENAYKQPDIDFNIESNQKEKIISYLISNFKELGFVNSSTVWRYKDFSIVLKLKDFYGKYQHQIYYDDIINSKIFKIKNTINEIFPMNGCICLPSNEEIYKYSAVNKLNKGLPHTFNDYRESLSNFYKIDLFPQTYCRLLSLLSKTTKLSLNNIKYDDPKVLSLFTNDKALDKKIIINKSHNSFIGISDYNFKTILETIELIKPKTVNEILKIEASMHGTNIWTNNGEELIKSGKNINNLFSSRDDIFNYLISKGADTSFAYQTMETIRKGKGVNDKLKEKLIELKVPDYLIESMNKIHYAFYKAASITTVIAKLKLLYYKIYYPKEFYTCLFKIHRNMKIFNNKLLNLSIDELINHLGPENKNELDKSMVEELIEAFERGYIYQNGRFVTKKDINNEKLYE